MKPHRSSADLTQAAQASELVAACEQTWSAIQRNHAGVPDAVIVMGSAVERGRLVKLGHFWSGRWIVEGQIWGLDVRGDGGSIIAPRSNHGSGGTYAFVDTDSQSRSCPPGRDVGDLDTPDQLRLGVSHLFASRNPTVHTS